MKMECPTGAHILQFTFTFEFACDGESTTYQQNEKQVASNFCHYYCIK